MKWSDGLRCLRTCKIRGASRPHAASLTLWKERKRRVTIGVM